MDYTPSSRRLSEISHLFLSDVRKKQTEGTARPARTPPGAVKGDAGVDLTPDEFAMTLQPTTPAAPSFKPLRTVIAHHLGEAMRHRVRDFAAALGGPVGVIYADDDHVRVCVADVAAEITDEPAVEPMSLSRLREVIVELDQDVSQWLLVLPDPRSSDAQALLHSVPTWTLLTTADHDAVVAAYRTLKGICGDAKPALSVAVCAPADADELNKTVKKLAGVCGQFLNIVVTAGPAVAASSAFGETCLLECVADDKTDSHWPVLAGLVDGADAADAAEMNSSMNKPVFATIPQRPAIASEAAADIRPNASREPAITAPAPPPASAPAPAGTSTPTIADDALPILDLPAHDASPAAVLRAVLSGGGCVESPVKAPALPDAVVAVDRDRRLTLLAVAAPGLSDLRAVAAALRWISENRALIAMAVPQLSIDAFAEPTLRLYVDQTDATADALRPLLAVGAVTIVTYRKVRWSGRLGLLLDAA